MQTIDILNKFLDWAPSFFVGFFSYLLVSKLDEKYKKTKLLRSLRLELFTNLSLILDYNNEEFTFNFRELGVVVNGFDTKIYQKLKEEVILIDLHKDIRSSIIKIYQTISIIQRNYEAKYEERYYITDCRLDMLETEIPKLLDLLKNSTFKEKVKRLYLTLNKKINQKKQL